MNKNYFKYLLVSNKVLFAFISLIEIIITAITPINSYTAESIVYKVWIISIIASFVLPILLFSHALNKKAVDSYFSLPVKRKEMAITTLITMFVVISIPAIAILSFLFTHQYLWTINSLYLIVLTLIVIATLLIFNSGVYLLGNNMLDGVVMIGSYHFLPIILALLESAVNNVMYYGYYGSKRFSDYLSYIFISVELMDSLCCKLFRNDCSVSLTPFILTTIVYIAIGVIMIFNNYVKRKGERADSISERISAYPFIIYSYATILLITETFSNYQTTLSFIAILNQNLLEYVLIIAMFIIATFIYKRKISISIKSLLYLSFVCITSILLLQYVYSTEGFQLSYNYDRNPNNIYLDVSRYVYYDAQNVKDEISINEYDIYAEIRIDNSDPRFNEFVNYLNNIRDNNIKEHFQLKETNNTSSLSIVQNYTEHPEYKYIMSGENYYYQSVNLTFDDYAYLSQFGEVTMTTYDTEKEQVQEYEFNEFMEMLKEKQNG